MGGGGGHRSTTTTSPAAADDANVTQTQATLGRTARLECTAENISGKKMVRDQVEGGGGGGREIGREREREGGMRE